MRISCPTQAQIHSRPLPLQSSFCWSTGEFVLSWKKLVVIMRYCAFILWCDLRWRNKFYCIIGLSLIPVPYLNRAARGGGARKMSQITISLSRSPPQIECGRCIVRMMAMAGPGRTLTMYGSNPLSSRYVFLRVLLGFHPISTCILMFSIFRFGLLFCPIWLSS